MTTDHVRHVPAPEFGPMLRAARARAGLQMRDAARQAGISAGYLADLEHGRRCPSVAVAAELYRVLALTPEETQFLASTAVAGRGRSNPYRSLRT